jgi:Reverse transcriptase (RNA-dependent DNA polymerase)
MHFKNIRVRKEDQWKTAFRCTFGVYQYEVMSLGLCKAPSVFLRFINNIFQNIYPENVFVYLDDILIATHTLNENKHITHTVIKQLLANNLFGKSTKCEFIKSQIIFLGFRISAGIINLTETHLKHIQNSEALKKKTITIFYWFMQLFTFIYSKFHTFDE